MKDLKRFNFLVFPTFLLIGWFLVFKNIPFGANAQAMDDALLLGAIPKIQSLSDYLELVRQNAILDIQPIRDLTYFLDSRASSIVGFSTYHLSNLLIYFGFLTGYWSNLKLISEQKKSRAIVFAWGAFHPAMILVACWVGGRKHLLALLFLSWSHYFLMRGLKSNRLQQQLLGVVLFLGSLLSQPIFFLYGVWVTIFLKKSKRGNLLVPWVYFLLSGSIAGFNFIYYRFYYIADKSTLPGKFQAINLESIYDRVRLLGRFVLQLAVPIYASPVPYNLYQEKSFVGLVLALAIFIGGFLFYRKTKQIPYLKFFLICCPLIPFLVFTTDTGGIDSYIIGCVFFIGLVFYDSNAFEFKKKSNDFLAWSVIAILVMISSQVADGFTTNSNYWARVLLTDPSDYAEIKYDLSRMNEGIELPEVGESLDHLWSKYQNKINEAPEGLFFIMGQYIAGAPLSIAEKDKLFKKYQVPNSFFAIQWIHFLYDSDRIELFFENMQSIWRANKSGTLNAIVAYGSRKTLDRWYSACLRFQKNECESIILDYDVEQKKILSSRPKW